MRTGKTGKLLFRIGYYKNTVLVQERLKLGVSKNLWGKGKIVGVWGGGITSSQLEEIYNHFENRENSPNFDPQKAAREYLLPLSTPELVDTLKYMCGKHRNTALIAFQALAVIRSLKGSRFPQL